MSIATRVPLAFALLAALALAPRAHAQVWNESGDAGPLPATAQVTSGSGPLNTITGSLASPGDVDMYCIHVPVPGAFQAMLQCVVIQGPDLWLFDANGKGVSANSWCAGGGKVITSAYLSTPGTYYIAVAYDGVWPFGIANYIWNPGSYPERAPDGPDPNSTVAFWAGTGNVQPMNPYQINFLGTTYCDAATATTPATWGKVKMLYR